MKDMSNVDPVLHYVLYCMKCVNMKHYQWIDKHITWEQYLKDEIFVPHRQVSMNNVENETLA